MCGISGTVNWGDKSDWEKMCEIQEHRGPDYTGLWHLNSHKGADVFLGSNRLSILDLSTNGNMPMSSSDGRFTIVYNGEIYNYKLLRSRMVNQGYNFKSSGDTEVLLSMYEVYGDEFVSQLNGMFALAIWDSLKRNLFIARDHFGIKPLYYSHLSHKFAFASEMKALLKLPGMKNEIDWASMNQFLTLLWIPEPRTLIKDIKKLPPGHYANFSGEKLDIKMYWDLDFPEYGHSFSKGEVEIASELTHKFKKVVKSQLVSDVPLGSFLSSGLDSSSIVAATSDVSKKPINTYTIGFHKKYTRGEITLDEISIANNTADYFNCNHNVIIVQPNVVELLPKLIWNMDDPVADPAIITAYLVAKEASRSVKVLLSGVGGDEIFGGYRKYQAHEIAKYYKLISKNVRSRFLEPVIASLPTMRNSFLKGYIRLAKKMARSGSLAPQERFLTDSTYINKGLKREICTEDVMNCLEKYDPWEIHYEHFSKVKHADFINQMLYVDCKTFMPSLNLNYNDKMCMAASVEARVPFLDWEFAEWVAWNIPPNLKIRGKTTKYILREAMKNQLPKEVLSQPKAGFFAPIDYWLSKDLRPLVDDMLSEHSLKKRNIFNSKSVRRLISEHQKGYEDWSMQIWQILTLEMWMDTFL